MWNSGSVVHSTSSAPTPRTSRAVRAPPVVLRVRADARPWPARWCRRCRGSRAGRPGCTAAGVGSASAPRPGQARTRAMPSAAAASPRRRRSPTTQIACSARPREVRRLPAARGTAASITSSRAPLSASKYSICGPIDAVLIGTATAPSQPQPRKASSELDAVAAHQRHPVAARRRRRAASAPARARGAPRPRRACDQRRAADARAAAASPKRCGLALQHRRQRALARRRAASMALSRQSSSVPPPR